MSCDKTLTIKVNHFFTFFSCFCRRTKIFLQFNPNCSYWRFFFPDLTGHNISEAAAAGCAVLTGQFSFIGPFHFVIYAFD